MQTSRFSPLRHSKHLHACARRVAASLVMFALCVPRLVGAQTFSPTGSLNFQRSWSTLTRLPDGRVLVMGGYSWLNGFVASCKMYDPATGQWSPTGAMPSSRYSFKGVVLHDGRVLVAGGGFAAFGSTIYDPATGQWSNTSPLNFP